MNMRHGTGGEPRSGVGRQGPEASPGGVQGMHRADNAGATKEALRDASAEDLGGSADGGLRDRRGRGAPSMGDVRSDAADDESSERR